jgi:hypothetical protein
MKRFLAACMSGSLAAAAALPLAVGSAYGQSEPDQGLQLLIFLYAVRDTDDRCGGLSVEERNSIEEMIGQGLSQAKLTPEQQALLEKGLSDDQIDCDNPGFIEMYRMTQGSGETPSKEEPDMSDADLKSQLESGVSELAAGGLKALEGCWSSDMADWKLQLCFTRGGDGAEMMLNGPKGKTLCTLDAGQARSREGGAFFYAFSSKPQCSDGRTIGHVEGMCPELGERTLGCFLSIYENGNFAFMTDEGGSDPLGGELRFNRD